MTKQTITCSSVTPRENRLGELSIFFQRCLLAQNGPTRRPNHVRYSGSNGRGVSVPQVLV